MRRQGMGRHRGGDARADGAVIVAGDTRAEIAAQPVHGVIDTTGAGDLFAAGFYAPIPRTSTSPLVGAMARSPRPK